MNIIDRLLQIVAVEVGEKFFILLKRISEEPEALFAELGRDGSAILLRDLYDVCDGHKEDQEFLRNTEFAKLVSGEKKILKGQIITADSEEPKAAEDIAKEFNEKSRKIVDDLREKLDKIQKEN